MDINWENIDNLEDYFITYLLYKESKTVSQISKIRNISSTEASEQLIQAKLKIKEMQKMILRHLRIFWINFRTR